MLNSILLSIWCKLPRCWYYIDCGFGLPEQKPVVVLYCWFFNRKHEIYQFERNS